MPPESHIELHRQEMQVLLANRDKDFLFYIYLNFFVSSERLLFEYMNKWSACTPFIHIYSTTIYNYFQFKSLAAFALSAVSLSNNSIT